MTPVSITVWCHAKLNLFLKVYEVREDGYHDIISVMQSVDYGDRIILENTDSGGIEIACTNPDIPTDESNIVWKAVELLAEFCDHPVTGLRVSIEKFIPVMSGLAGGSSNCAGTLIGLNKLWNLGLEVKTLIEIGSKLGSDVPFCLVGGTAIAQGRGEKLEPYPMGIADVSNPGAFIIVLSPVMIKTQTAYNELDQEREKSVKKWDSLEEQVSTIRGGWLNAITMGNIPYLFHNDFEETVFSNHPELELIRTNIRNQFGHALLSGSGSSMFSWFPSMSEAYTARDRYNPVAGEVAVVSNPVPHGISIEG